MCREHTTSNGCISCSSYVLMLCVRPSLSPTTSFILFSPDTVEWRAIVTTYGSSSGSSSGDENEIVGEIQLGVLPGSREDPGNAKASIFSFRSNPVYIDVDADSKTKVECVVDNRVGTAAASIELPPKSQVSALTQSTSSLGPGEIVGIVLLVVVIILPVPVYVRWTFAGCSRGVRGRGCGCGSDGCRSSHGKGRQGGR